MSKIPNSLQKSLVQFKKILKILKSLIIICLKIIALAKQVHPTILQGFQTLLNQNLFSRLTIN
jgi:hypothetical protein